MADNSDKVIVWEVPGSGGEVGFTFPTNANGVTAEGEMQRLLDEGVAENAKVMDKSDILADPYFMWAVKKDGSSYSVDVQKARDVHMNNIRLFRNAELKRLDNELIKAISRDDQTEIDSCKAQMQELRDLPTTVSLSNKTKLSTIKSTWPDQLPENTKAFAPKDSPNA